MPTAGPAINPDACRAIREVQGIKVVEAASRIGMAASQLSNVEAGRRGVSVTILQRMAEAYGVPRSALLARTAPCPRCTKEHAA